VDRRVTRLRDMRLPSCAPSAVKSSKMPNKMLIDATHPEETRVVVVRGNRVEEFDFETAQRKQLRGNIYLAKVTRVEPSLQAAFIEYGGNRHGFLAFSEIHPDYYQIPVADRQALIEADERAHREAEEESENRSSRHRRPRHRNARRRGNGERVQSEVVNAESSEPPQAAQPHDHEHHDHGETSHSHAHDAEHHQADVGHHGHEDHGHDDAHDHAHKHDNNFRAAYVHVLADAVTSVLAIVALFCGWCFGWRWLDPAVGIVGAFIAGWLLPRLGVHIMSGMIGAIIDATIGAVILLLVIRLVRRA